MIAVIHVGVSLARPPKQDAVIRYVVEAETETKARLLACQWAAYHPRVVMPVWDSVEDILEI